MSTMNYAGSDLKPPRRWPFRLAIGGGAFLVMLAAAMIVPCRRVTFSIDAVTGSTREETTWLGIDGVPHIATSPLEKRLKAADIAFTPKWHTLADYSYSAIGMRHNNGHGFAPPIHDVYRVLDLWVPTVTDDELRNFVRIMQGGTETEQKAVVDAIEQRIFDE